MKPDDYRDPRLTEQRNPRSNEIDIADAEGIVDLMHSEDKTVAQAVYSRKQQIARAIELAHRALSEGGRIIYVGAGTSGRLGVLDAAECPPTFGSSPDRVIGLIAGGRDTLIRSKEGVEDDEDAARGAIREAEIGPRDLMVGIAASGTTPYVRAALAEAAASGAKRVLITCTHPPADLRPEPDLIIDVLTGPEAVTGSTRLKAGTATKMVLNMITTGAMVLQGKTYGNLMVDLMATSEKLRDRGERIVMEVTGVDRSTARTAIAEAGGSVKLALVIARLKVEPEEARERLERAGGVLRRVIGDPPPGVPTGEDC